MSTYAGRDIKEVKLNIDLLYVDVFRAGISEDVSLPEP
jgi:hypothetical protein